MARRQKHKVESAVMDALKSAGIGLAVVAVLPVFIPVAIAVLTVTEIGEKLKKCPTCESRRLNLKFTEPAGSSCFTLTEQSKRRHRPVYSYYECAQCLSLFKKVYGEPLVPITATELQQVMDVAQADSMS